MQESEVGSSSSSSRISSGALPQRKIDSPSSTSTQGIAQEEGSHFKGEIPQATDTKPIKGYHYCTIIGPRRQDTPTPILSGEHHIQRVLNDKIAHQSAELAKRKFAKELSKQQHSANSSFRSERLETFKDNAAEGVIEKYKEQMEATRGAIEESKKSITGVNRDILSIGEELLPKFKLLQENSKSLEKILPSLGYVCVQLQQISEEEKEESELDINQIKALQKAVKDAEFSLKGFRELVDLRAEIASETNRDLQTDEIKKNLQIIQKEFEIIKDDTTTNKTSTLPKKLGLCYN